MQRQLTAILTALVLLTFCRGASTAALQANKKPKPNPAPYVPGMVMAFLKPGTDVAKFNRDYHTHTLSRTPKDPWFCFGTQKNANVPAIAARMGRDPRVLRSAPNMGVAVENIGWTTGFDAGHGGPKYVNQSSLPQIHFNLAQTEATGAGITVAVLDTGISYTNPLFAGKLVPGYNFIDNNADADDLPGQIDSSGNHIPDEAVGHGTFIAGLITRLAPDAKLMPVKILDSDGHGNEWALIEGLHFALDHGAKVINVSLSEIDYSPMVQDAITWAWNAGAVIVASAGNQNSEQPQFPAAYTNVISVAGVGGDGTKAPFSNFGATVDVSAPAVDLISAFWDGRYVEWSGTSFAAALVSGEAALVMSTHSEMWMEPDAAIVIDNAAPTDPGFPGKLGTKGMIDVDAAVAAALVWDDDSGGGGGGGDDHGGHGGDG